MVPHCQIPRCPPLLYGAALSDSALSTPLYGAVLSGSALSTLAIWCRIVSSRVVHPCSMVPRCPVSRCQPSQFRWSRDVQFRVFSRPHLDAICSRWLVKGWSNSHRSCRRRSILNVVTSQLWRHCHVTSPFDCPWPLSYRLPVVTDSLSSLVWEIFDLKVVETQTQNSMSTDNKRRLKLSSRKPINMDQTIEAYQSVKSGLSKFSVWLFIDSRLVVQCMFWNVFYELQNKMFPVIK